MYGYSPFRAFSIKPVNARSLICSRSNCANIPILYTNSLPIADVTSKHSTSDINLTSFTAQEFKKSIISDKLRVNQSN